MNINELAKRLDLTPRAIRLYEAKGLLMPARNPDNDYRVYTERDAWRLQTIAALREIGLSLAHIQKLLLGRDDGDTARIHHELELQRMAMVSKWVEAKSAIAVIDELIRRLERQQDLQLSDLSQLSEQLRQIHKSRDSWKDAWDFDRIAGEYDDDAAYYAAGPLVPVLVYEQALDLIVQWIAPQTGEVGLDIGTGTGNLAARLHGKDAVMHAIDQSAQMLARCRAKHPFIQAKLGNALALPYVQEQFDFIVSAFAFHHLNETQQTLALEEMDRVLKPGGRICLAALMEDHGERPARQPRAEHPQTEQPPGETPDGRAIPLDEIIQDRVHADHTDRPAAAAGSPANAAHKYPADRARLVEWFRGRNYITIQQRLHDGVHAVYAVRKF
ncbi:methyltransferase domain-containing protein [Paenibacillus aurantiacus]|uniref:Methyltransferase domain-containing protein n=1 Tax=Paenibacillus aurantiacus TaxID=1936118 RepID=A0ABV5KX74_9BACL